MYVFVSDGKKPRIIHFDCIILIGQLIDIFGFTPEDTVVPVPRLNSDLPTLTEFTFGTDSSQPERETDRVNRSDST
jgi:hypothetical protein